LPWDVSTWMKSPMSGTPDDDTIMCTVSECRDDQSCWAALNGLVSDAELIDFIQSVMPLLALRR
jgi:hypothetical protein